MNLITPADGVSAERAPPSPCPGTQAVVIPGIVIAFKAVDRHYRSVEKALVLRPGDTVPVVRNTVVVPVGNLNRGVLHALDYARALHPDRLVALSVGLEDQHVDELRTRWAQLCSDIDLEVVESPYREFTKPILGFLDALDRQGATMSSRWSSPSLWSTAGGSRRCTTRALSSSRAGCCSVRTRW